MMVPISPKLATIIRENEELRALITYLIKESNFEGQKGNSVTNINLIEKKKNFLLLRFFNEYYLEWE